MTRLRRWLGPLRKFATQPLLLAQVASSLGGAIAMLLAAALMEPERFTLFTLISLASITTVGAVRAGLFQPALIELRLRPGAFTRFRHGLLAAVASAVLATTVVAFFGPLSPFDVVLLCLGGVFPVMHDWVRFRAMELDRRWAVFWADAIRLALVAVVSPLTLVLTTDPIIYQAAQGFAYAIPALLVFPRLPKVSDFLPLRVYRRSAGLQFGDYLIGQFNTTIPLLALGGMGASATIGGVRLAQTLLGPLGLVFTASTTNLMVDAANSDHLSQERALYRSGEKLANGLGLLSVAAIATLVIFVWISGFGLRGVSNPDLLNGLLLVGAAMASSGWAGIHAVILRLLNYQVTATVGRAVLVACSTTGYLVGYALAGVDGSLVGGFLAAAVAAPLAFVVPSLVVYRRLIRPASPPTQAD